MNSWSDLLASGLEAFIYLAIVLLLGVFLLRPLLRHLLAKPGGAKPPGAGGARPAPGGEEAVAFDRPLGDRAQTELLARLAASDPEKAGALVKKWLRQDN